MRRTLAVWLTVGACALGATGCGSSNDTAGPDDPTPSTTSTSSSGKTGDPTIAPPTDPNSSSTRPTKTTPAAPTMPTAATHKTKAGAKAFVRYYITVLNYAWTAESGDGIRDLSAKRCKLCNGFADYVEDVIGRGGYQEGGDWVVNQTRWVPGQPLTRPIVLPAIQVSKGKWKKSEDAKVSRIHPHKINYEFFLHWDPTRPGWSVTKVTP